MCYNIYRGGKEGKISRIPLIEQVIKAESPDFLAFQEANDFERDNCRMLKDISKNSGLPYTALAEGSLTKSGKQYHAASFSRYPFKQIEDWKGQLRNAALTALFSTPLGEIAIYNVHLSPGTEDERLKELELILFKSSQYSQSVLLGDLNSLSPQDAYPSGLSSQFNEAQQRKFLAGGQLQTRVIQRILERGYKDSAVCLGLNVTTVPTGSNQDKGNKAPLRIDYVFVSPSLVDKIKEMRVVKNEISEKASDHYPLIAVFE